ncbi:Sec-independent protein translocase protein TatB [Kordiimonas aquimaris]|uniref:Sec-independent protein translocase protein TatB n=1 Tax=Kordiimonas aquimaris TaxID=707591 RepID=UPI0021D0575A|nr:Sec-independent protein translocase protein TatB [Kordiimonas aquimaris]
MFDIGAMELFVVATLALVVVGPKELPKLLRTVAGFVRRMREMAAEFRSGVEDLAAEVEREVDPFADLRKEEGLRPGMSPSEITEHIMTNREEENSIASPKQKATASNPQKPPTESQKAEKKPKSSKSSAQKDKKKSDSGAKPKKPVKKNAEKSSEVKS